jgi:azurin
VDCPRFVCGRHHPPRWIFSSCGKNPLPVGTPEASLSQRLLKGVSQEIYALQRRTPISLPPDMTGKDIIVKGTITKGNRPLEGFIVGQGGTDAGYGVYIKDGKLTMVVKQDGQVYKAATSEPLPDKFEMESRLTGNGAMILTIDGKEVAKARAPSLFTKPLVDVIRVQRDHTNENSIGAYTGDYTNSFDFSGNMQNATLEVKKPLAAENPIASGGSANPKATVITIKIVENQMQYDKKLFAVKAGQSVVLNLENPDIMQHNLVICKPGTTEKVGKAADILARDPKAVDKNYVPQVPEVLFATKLVNPGESFSLEFTVPNQPGDYPFMCTFPGHWSIMKGVMRVEKSNAVPTTR